MVNYAEIVEEFLRRRFRAEKVELERVYWGEEVVEVAGTALISGNRKRFTVLLSKDDGTIRGYGLR